MGEKFWWIYDIISVVVIIFFVFSGARKGFSKILITALGCVASIAAALFIGSKTTDFIYDKFFIKNLPARSARSQCAQNVSTQSRLIRRISARQVSSV